jgi:hypothetical protein
LGIKGRAIIWDRAEPCMDIDKPHQLELLREDLARQERKDAPRTKKAPAKKTARAKPAASKSAKAAKPKATAKVR